MKKMALLVGVFLVTFTIVTIILFLRSNAEIDDFGQGILVGRAIFFIIGSGLIWFGVKKD